MTTDEHNMLVEMHARVFDLPSKSNLTYSTNRVIRKINSVFKVEEKQAPQDNQTRVRQVAAVRRILFKAYQEERTLSLHAACLEAWEPLKDGYPTPKSLYEYCHAHENEF